MGTQQIGLLLSFHIGGALGKLRRNTRQGTIFAYDDMQAGMLWKVSYICCYALAPIYKHMLQWGFVLK